MGDHSWHHVLNVFLGTLAFFWIWDKIDGASRWERKQREAHKKALAEGWKIWASTPGN